MAAAVRSVRQPFPRRMRASAAHRDRLRSASSVGDAAVAGSRQQGRATAGSTHRHPPLGPGGRAGTRWPARRQRHHDDGQPASRRRPVARAGAARRSAHRSISLAAYLVAGWRPDTTRGAGRCGLPRPAARAERAGTRRGRRLQRGGVAAHPDALVRCVGRCRCHAPRPALARRTRRPESLRKPAGTCRPDRLHAGLGEHAQRSRGDAGTGVRVVAAGRARPTAPLHR